MLPESVNNNDSLKKMTIVSYKLIRYNLGIGTYFIEYWVYNCGFLH